MDNKLMKYVVLAFLLLLPTVAMAQMDPAIEMKKAENFVRELGENAITALDETKDDEAARKEAFKTILNKNFDMDTISRFAMGRYWSVATDDQKKEYNKLFRKMVVDVYTNKFSDYTDQELKVVGTKPAGRDYIVNSLISSPDNAQPVKVDWRVRRNKVIDVIVEGVSMSVTQRNDFAAVIQQNGGEVASLIDHLKK